MHLKTTNTVPDGGDRLNRLFRMRRSGESVSKLLYEEEMARYIQLDLFVGKNT